MMAVQKIAYGSPARLTGLPVAGLRYTPIRALTASPPSTPAATPAISTARAIPSVAGRATKNGMITAAAITGRSSRILLILRAGPRSVASTMASTTPLRIIASVSSEGISRSLRVSFVSDSTFANCAGERVGARAGPRHENDAGALVPGGTRAGPGQSAQASAHGLTCRSRVPADTGGMPRTLNWLTRTLGYVWLGLLAFLVAPPSAPFALPVQIAGYVLLGLALLAWAVMEAYPPATARYGTRVVPVIRGVIAVAAGFACGAGGGGTAMVAFAFVAAMAAGVNNGLAAGLAVTGAGVLAIEVSGLAFGQGLGTLLGLPALVLSGLVIGRNWGAYRVQAEQAAALLAQREQLQAEQRRADLLDERARIAREIHDVLAHSLGALGIQIQAARAVLHKDADQAGDLLAAAQQMAAEGLVETRRAVQALRTDTHAQRYHVPVSYDTGGVPAALPPDVTLALVRIAQEALVNAAKHAEGHPVAVRLDYGDGDVRLTVRNDLPP